MAITDCNKAIELDPSLTEAYLNRAVDYCSKGQFDPAIADCSKTLLCDPSLAGTYITKVEART